MFKPLCPLLLLVQKCVVESIDTCSKKRNYCHTAYLSNLKVQNTSFFYLQFFLSYFPPLVPGGILTYFLAFEVKSLSTTELLQYMKVPHKHKPPSAPNIYPQSATDVKVSLCKSSISHHRFFTTTDLTL